MVGFRSELQGMVQVLDGGGQFPPVQFGDADVVVIISRSEHGSGFFLKLLLASVNEDFRSFLNLGLFGMLRNQTFKTSDSLFKVLGVHRLETGLVCLYGIGKMF